MARDARGFTLVEVLVAMAVLVAGMLAGAAVILNSVELVARARAVTSTAVLAAAKLEQLSALSWHVEVADDGTLSDVSDLATDLTGVRPGANGRGLRIGSADAFWTSTGGFVDYLDSSGRSLGGDGTAARRARFIRRWSVTSPPALTPDLIVSSVRVTSVESDSEGRGPTKPGEVRAVAARARTVR